MMIQGELIKVINVTEILTSIFGSSIHSKRQQSMSNAVLGIINSASLIVHRVGLGYALEHNLSGKHAIKQVDRLLSNEKFNVEDCYSHLIPYLIGNRKEVILAMDWTDFAADNQSTIQISLVTNHGRATPLLWKTVKKSTLKKKRNDYEDELLCQLRDAIPKDIKVTILADRGFGDVKLYDFLKEKLGFHFVIRFRGNINVTTSSGETKKANDCVGKNGRARKYKNAKVTSIEYEVPTVICVKAKDMKQTWCIVSSESDVSASLLIKLYSKRWGIEPQFRDTKDIHFGMGLHSTTISIPERRDRLLLLSALAVIILTILGAAGEKLGLDKKMKANTVKHRTHSLFRQGVHYYNKITAMTIEERKVLIDTFMKILLEIRELKNVLLVI